MPFFSQVWLINKIDISILSTEHKQGERYTVTMCEDPLFIGHCELILSKKQAGAYMYIRDLLSMRSLQYHYCW